MTDTKETQALIESANASIKLLNGFIKSPTVYNGNPIVLRAFGHVKFYVENSITALQSQAEKDRVIKETLIQIIAYPHMSVDIATKYLEEHAKIVGDK